ncbi:MAG: carboxymuconolactone decarboxylase family protein [Bacteroidales bacterium]
MNSLDKQQQKIVAIAANTAVGNLDELKSELNAGLDNGLTVNQIKEVLVQMYAYCGFPRSLQGINTFMAVMDERKAKELDDNIGAEASAITDTRDKYIRGKANLQQLTGVEEKAPAGANAFTPAIDTFLKEHLFADIFERDVLTFQQRELATISALAAMEGVAPMLRSHVNMGRNTGLSEEQIQEALAIAGKIGSDSRATFLLGTRGSADWFTGEVYVQGLVNPDEMENLYSVGQVTFMPGGRTHWHTHPIGQTLLVLEGCGWYQERGKTAQELVKGSVITIPKDVEHWHGASAGMKLVHIAISNMENGNNVTWMSPVNDQEYKEVNK